MDRPQRWVLRLPGRRPRHRQARRSPRQGGRCRPHPAGATFPRGEDPNDENIRIAPTVPTMDELEAAMEVLTAAVVLAAAEQLLDDGSAG
nr:hypothetical protein [Arsenicicoccus piscis]